MELLNCKSRLENELLGVQEECSELHERLASSETRVNNLLQQRLHTVDENVNLFAKYEEVWAQHQELTCHLEKAKVEIADLNAELRHEKETKTRLQQLLSFEKSTKVNAAQSSKDECATAAVRRSRSPSEEEYGSDPSPEELGTLL